MRRLACLLALLGPLGLGTAAAEEIIVVSQTISCHSSALESKYSTVCDGAAAFIRPEHNSIISCHLAFRVTWEPRNPAPFNLYYAAFQANASTCAEDTSGRFGDLQALVIQPALALASSGNSVETSPATVWFTFDKESKEIQVCLEASFQGPTEVVCHTPQMRTF
jgi:hypothetical protein